MIELEFQDVDLREEAASVADYFEAAAAERGQHVEVSGQATVRCDRSLARRAITNLLSNAVRYAPSSVRIDVAIAPEGSDATVAVSNPATGITGEDLDLDRLFARFARRDESRARGPEGAGLGLAIVDSIMKLQGGRVEASCQDGSITFLLRFPIGLSPG